MTHPTDCYCTDCAEEAPLAPAVWIQPDLRLNNIVTVAYIDDGRERKLS
jgi:hypothetical protein